MTRINSDLDPKLLLDQHLMAEYRELPMVYAALRRSLRTKTKEEILKNIPEKFTLNAGHVRFFYNKLFFLHKRYQRLQEELKTRSFNLDPSRVFSLVSFAPEFKNDWTSTPADDKIIKERILEKVNHRPNWYLYMGEPVAIEFINHLYTS